jgi:C4-dicarboxylate transporter DctQ subunit
MKLLAKLDSLLARVEILLIAAFCTVAFILGVMQVVLRYAFGIGFHWNEGVFVTLTVSAMMLGGSRAVRDGLHARVEIIANILPERGVHVCNLIALISALCLSALYVVCGYLYVQFVNSMGIRDIDSNIPDAITYSIVPISMSLFVIRYIIKIVDWRSDPGEYSRMSEIEHDSAGGAGGTS